MTTQEIATRLVGFCQKGEYEAAQRELYAGDVISIEPFATHGFEKETRGLAAVIDKGRRFESLVEESYGNIISNPLVTAQSIAFILTMDVKMKGRARETVAELCVYQVKEDKIVTEQFFM